MVCNCMSISLTALKHARPESKIMSRPVGWMNDSRKTRFRDQPCIEDLRDEVAVISSNVLGRGSETMERNGQTSVLRKVKQVQQLSFHPLIDCP